MTGSRADGAAPTSDCARHARQVIEANQRLCAALGENDISSQLLDILLFLLAEDAGEGVSTGCCCAAVVAPRTTALRWIKTLQSGGLVEQFSHEGDRRIVWLTLTAKARHALQSWLDAIDPARQSVTPATPADE